MFSVSAFSALCVFCVSVKCDKILAIFPYQGQSHYNMFGALTKELAARGHEVDVMGHYPLPSPRDRYTDLSLKGSLPFLTNNLSLESLGTNMYHNAMFIYKHAGTHVCETILNTPMAKKLKHTTKKYDVLVTEIFGTDCMLGFAHHLKLPSIGMISSVNLPWSSDMVGLPDNPSYIPNYFTSYLPQMTLKERIMNTIVYIFAKLGYNLYSIHECNILARNFFGDDLPDIRALANNFSLVLVNSHFSLHQSRPFVPNFVEVGGLHIRQQNPLSKHFEDLINSYPNGTIYLSFGSMVLTELFPVYKLQAMYDALGELPYRILWKGNDKNLPRNLTIPKNIQYEEWMPQLDLLCHPSVKLFISHGGLMGTQESIYCATPLLGIPLFADQELNIKNSVSKGFAIKVAYANITKDSILIAAKQLLQNPIYRNNVERASDLFRDRPMSAMDTAVYWIEYVSRHKGAPHLRSVGATLPWHQYFLVDVMIIILLGTVFTIISIYYILFIIYCMFIRTTSQKIKQN